MWAKRFPVPEFDRHSLKNLDWTAPEIQDEILPEGHFGSVAVRGNESLYSRFDFTGEFLLVVGCRLPDQSVVLKGNSFAWPIHRVVITDSLDAASCNVLADWTTPRPMNTRLGPDQGIPISTSQAFVMIGHKYADHWTANRIMMDNEWTGVSGNGFRILSSSETEIDDFHDAVVYFEW